MTIPILFTLSIVFLLTQTDERRVVFTRRALAALVLTVTIILAFGATKARAAGQIYYISFSSGSNSNPGTLASPWKSSPYMQPAAGCAGMLPSYIPTFGDQMIFKGGDTWPAACFPLAPTMGGNSSVSDYYGVCNSADSASPCFGGTSWPSSGWTRPIFDAQQTRIGHFFYLDNIPSAPYYVTIDNIEMKNQNVSFGFVTDGAIRALVGGSLAVVNVTVENVYIHDFMTSSQLSSTNGAPWYSAGGIDGYIRLLNSVINDTNGFGFNSNGVQVNGGMMGGGCWDCQEVSNTKFVNTMAACFGAPLCHDSEFTGISQSPFDTTVGSGGYGPLGSYRPHTQIVEDENVNVGGFIVYNNYFHDNTPGICITVGYKNSYVFNNVMTNSCAGGSNQIDLGWGGTDSSSFVGGIFNNTLDCQANGTPCIKLESHIGTINAQNNITIPTSGQPGILNVGGPGTLTPNRGGTTPGTMTASEATTYGFTATNKYNPSSSDPNTVGQGLNLTSSCSGNLTALCTDTSGASWFGGSGKARGSSWDLGAFQFQGGGSGGPPTSSVTAPLNGATVSGSSVTLTATCTPVSPATCTSVQFFVDGSAFGSPLTISPYTTTLNSTKISNGTNNHSIYAVATDSNGKTGTASTVTVSVANSTPGCVTSNPQAIYSQAITNQTGTFTAVWTETPNSAANDTDFGLSPTAASGFSSMSALLLADNSGVWKAWNNAVAGYAAVNSAPYTSGTVYSFSGTFTFSGGSLLNYSISETSPSSIVIASGYTPRASATGLAYWNLISDQGLYDTAQICNFQVGLTTSLNFAPASVNFGNVTVGTTASQTINVTSTGGATTFSSVTGLSGDLSIFSNGCTSSQTSCATVIHYTPSVAGPISQTVTYTDSATGSPQTVAVTGTGVSPTASLSIAPTSLNFGGVLICTPLTLPTCGQTQGPVTVMITSGPVIFSSTTFSGVNAGDFSAASNTCTGTVSAPSCQTAVLFKPTSLNPESATMCYADSATGSPHCVTLTGTGVNALPTPAPTPSMFVFTPPAQFDAGGPGR